MKKVEIKLNKRGHLIIISLSGCCTIFCIWGITLPDLELWVKFLLPAFVLLFLYHSYKTLSVIDDPVIVLTQTTIQIRSKNKDDIFLWSDIVDYAVHYKRSDQGVEYSLTLITNTESKEFQISGITKMPEELKEIINDFRRK